MPPCKTFTSFRIFTSIGRLCGHGEEVIEALRRRHTYAGRSTIDLYDLCFICFVEK